MLIWYPEVKSKGKHASKHAKTRSADPDIALAKQVIAIGKRLRRQERNKKLMEGKVNG